MTRKHEGRGPLRESLCCLITRCAARCNVFNLFKGDYMGNMCSFRGPHSHFGTPYVHNILYIFSTASESNPTYGISVMFL